MAPKFWVLRKLFPLQEYNLTVFLKIFIFKTGKIYLHKIYHFTPF